MRVIDSSNEEEETNWMGDWYTRFNKHFLEIVSRESESRPVDHSRNDRLFYPSSLR